MAAIPLNLLLEKGTDWDATFNIQNEDNTTPLNLTGYTAEAKMKKSYYSTTSTSFVVTFVDRYNGQLKIGLANTATAALEARRYVYDIVLTSPQSVKTRVIEGILEVTPGVTSTIPSMTLVLILCGDVNIISYTYRLASNAAVAALANPIFNCPL